MQNLERFCENSELGFKYLLNLALNEKDSWGKLKIFLEDLTLTYETSKKLNKVLLDKLESMQSNENKNKGSTDERKEEEIVENDSEDDLILMYSKKESFKDDASDVEKDVTIKETFLLSTVLLKMHPMMRNRGSNTSEM